MTFGLRVSHLRKAYQGRNVLQDCSCSFEKPGIYVITGANGCGKSTFLRICALLERPDAGEIIYDDCGRAVPADIELRRRITLVLPRVGLFNATVSRNASYGLRVRGVRGKAAAERVEKVLDFVGLIHKKDQNAQTLSSGEAQRLGIARSLVIDPEILFLDEPTASVDLRNTGIIEDVIRRLRDEGRSTVVMTTHDRDQAKRLADTALVMENGMISSS